MFYDILYSFLRDHYFLGISEGHFQQEDMHEEL